MTRREFLSAGSALPLAAAPHAPPSVLLIMCDQLNPRVLGVYGGPVDTPNLERIARRGVVFDGATCPTPVCSPSRASLVTGVYPHTHGIVRNVMRKDYPAAGGPETEEGLTAGEFTTEKLLRQAGYATHQYGKWHLHGDDLPYLPDQFGEHHEYADEMAETFAEVRRRPKEEWMDWYGWSLPIAVDPAYRASFVADPLPESGHRDFITKAGRLCLPLEKTFDYRVADKTVERLRGVGSQPFMITASFNLPHDPNVIPSPYYELHDPAKIQLPLNFAVREPVYEKNWSRRLVGTRDTCRIRELLRVYYGSVRLIDDQVGRILDALDETGRAGDTVVIFTADHGDMAGSHGMFWKSTSSFYDDVVTVPLLVCYPRRFQAGRSEAAASIVDICPTLLELCGQAIPRGVAGRSLAPSLSGRAASPDRQFSFCERVQGNPAGRRIVTAGAPASFMVRGQGWKYVRTHDGHEILYNLRCDPGEILDLAPDRRYRNRKLEMAAVLDSWLADTAYPS